AVAAWVGDTFQGLDELVNNAGFTRKFAATTPLAEAERERDALLDGNLKSAYLMSVAVLPHFADEGWRI
ncbi:SDR family NAD(P)-dependent oxidoreductase, partial [Pseudomonas aeruginosa]|uniref:SDR family NAD(P)-dependent oxidoreductase n=1 Tax=Pseudomonas aeruginosa TaxID=287 RepID=UPI003F7E66E3